MSLNKKRIIVKRRITHVYTDGSSLSNGRKGARAGYGVFFKDNDPRNLSEPFFIYPLTNNRAEIFACIRAVEQYIYFHKYRTKKSTLIINTDSEYTINVMTKWIEGWRKKGWKTSTKKPVKNLDLIYWLDKLMKLHAAEISIEFRHVSAHGKKEEPTERRYGNDKADEFAVAGAEFSKLADVDST